MHSKETIENNPSKAFHSNQPYSGDPFCAFLRHTVNDVMPIYCTFKTEPQKCNATVCTPFKVIHGLHHTLYYEIPLTHWNVTMRDEMHTTAKMDICWTFRIADNACIIKSLSVTPLRSIAKGITISSVWLITTACRT